MATKRSPFARRSGSPAVKVLSVGVIAVAVLAAVVAVVVEITAGRSRPSARSGAELEATTPEGLTVWHLAAEADAAMTLDELIALGVDLDKRSTNGMNTLDHAAAAGADVDAPSTLGQTALI